jgi:hypothetical protein
MRTTFRNRKTNKAYVRKYAAILIILCLSTPALARIELFPPAFKTEMVARQL